jgi:DNA-binding CsgD family transcriptional regulator
MTGRALSSIIQAMGPIEETVLSLIDEAADAVSAAEWAGRALGHLHRVLPHEDGYLAALGPTFLAESAPYFRTYVEHRDHFDPGMERGRAMGGRAGAFIDVEVYSARERARMPFFAELVGPLGVSSMLVAAVHFGGRATGILSLHRHGHARRFAGDDLERALPVLRAVGMAHGSLTGGAPRAPGDARQGIAAAGVMGRLSPRERQVVSLVADGYQNAQIAARLGSSIHTVRRQLDSVYAKTGIGSRIELGVLVDRVRGAGELAAGRNLKRVLADVESSLSR